MDYVALREKPRQLLALTSLEVAEFDELLTDFAPAWERWHTLDGKRRQFAATANARMPYWPAAA